MRRRAQSSVVPPCVRPSAHTHAFFAVSQDSEEEDNGDPVVRAVRAAQGGDASWFTGEFQTRLARFPGLAAALTEPRGYDLGPAIHPIGSQPCAVTGAVADTTLLFRRPPQHDAGGEAPPPVAVYVRRDTVGDVIPHLYTIACFAHPEYVEYTFQSAEMLARWFKAASRRVDEYARGGAYSFDQTCEAWRQRQEGFVNPADVATFLLATGADWAQSELKKHNARGQGRVRNDFRELLRHLEMENCEWLNQAECGKQLPQSQWTRELKAVMGAALVLHECGDCSCNGEDAVGARNGAGPDVGPGRTGPPADGGTGGGGPTARPQAGPQAAGGGGDDGGGPARGMATGQQGGSPAAGGGGGGDNDGRGAEGPGAGLGIGAPTGGSSPAGRRADGDAVGPALLPGSSNAVGGAAPGGSGAGGVNGEQGGVRRAPAAPQDRRRRARAPRDSSSEEESDEEGGSSESDSLPSGDEMGAAPRRRQQPPRAARPAAGVGSGEVRIVLDTGEAVTVAEYRRRKTERQYSHLFPPVPLTSRRTTRA